jgi:predicted AAA+ superfamily ATPase
MKLFQRKLETIIENNLFKKRIIVIYGPRQVGKTTLVRKIQSKFAQSSYYFSADDTATVEQFSNKNTLELLALVKNYKLIVIDEAQRIVNIGLVLKQIHDSLPDLQIIATGSSSFDLANKINEPLTGRKRTFLMFPLSIQELLDSDYNKLEIQANLSSILELGLYPQIFSQNKIEAQKDLQELTSSYLFKDIFNFEIIKNPDLLSNLLKALALQVGSEVSYQELAILLKVDQTTVQRYVNLLEQAFIIFKLPAFSRNKRNEISKSRKFYFYDTGIRNAIINNFNPMSLRSDTEAIWENFCILEKMKNNQYEGKFVNTYFWRNYNQQEIDYIEEKDDLLDCFEFKYSENKKAKLPLVFARDYPKHTFKLVHKKNWLEQLNIL